MVHPVIILVDTIFRVIYYLFIFYIILSWAGILIPDIRYNRNYQTAVEIIDSIFEPMFRPFRKIIPPLDLGGMAIDLTPIIFIMFILPITKFVVMQIILALVQ